MAGTSNIPPRDCVESTQFIQEKETLLDLEGCKRLDEVMRGMDIGLCQRPEQYPVIIEGVDYDLRMFPTRSFDTIPSFKIWYTFDEKSVTLLHIEVAEDDSSL